MRILQYEPSGAGGLRLYTQSLAKALVDLGIEIDILTQSDAEYESDGYSVIRKLQDPGRPVPRYMWALERLIANARNGLLRGKESSKDYDLCHIQLISPIVDWYLINRIRVPIVITVHDINPHDAHFWERNWPRQRIYQKANGIIVHSVHNAEAFLSQFNVDKSSLHVIRHGFDGLEQEIIGKPDSRKELGLPSDERIALFFGWIRSDKGLDVALKAMQYVSDWNLLVAGQCNDEPIYKDLAKGLGVDDRIEWRLGFIPDDAVRYYFQAADVLILPYKPKFESQSGVLFQSYRYKLPLIVADVGSLGETVREDESGIVVPPNDPRAIAQALLDILYLDHIDWDRIEEKYHWPNIAKQVVGVYRDVIDRDGARE